LGDSGVAYYIDTYSYPNDSNSLLTFTCGWRAGSNVCWNEWSNIANITVVAVTPTPFSILYPLNNTQYPYADVNVNVTANFTALTDCTLGIDGTPDGTVSGLIGIDTLVSYSPTFADGTHIINVTCYNGTDWFSTETNTFFVDTVNPLIATNFMNNTVVFAGHNLTGDFNFSDNEILYRVNITIDNSIIIFNKTDVGGTFFQYLLAYNTTGMSGQYNLGVTVADGHTAKLIDSKAYKIGHCFFGDCLTFDFVYPYEHGGIHIQSTDGAWSDRWTTAVENDRITFTYNPKVITQTETFIVTTDEPYDIINAPWTEYKSWIIYNNHWLDFNTGYNADVQIDRVSDTEAQVTLTFPDSAMAQLAASKQIKFSSIGDLNIVNKNYSFFVVNAAETYPASLFETQAETLTATVNYNPSSITDVNAVLNYSGTLITPTKTSNATDFVFSVNTNAPSFIASPTVDHQWTFFITGTAANVNISAPVQTQTVSEILLSNCYGTAANNTINYTIRDEITNATLDATVVGHYDYGASPSSFLKTLTFSISPANNTAICMYPYWATLYSNYTLQYSATNYFSRNRIDTNAVFNNVTQQVALYLLPFTSGIYARFNIVDGFNHPLSGVSGVMKDLAGHTIETEMSDATGLVSFTVNPANTYSFTFSLVGFPTYQANLKIVSSDLITIVLGNSQTTSFNNSYAAGIAYQFNPQGNLMNNTLYPFNFTMTSSIWTVTSCNFYLYDGATLLASTPGIFTATGCNAALPYNTGVLSSITGIARYGLNGTTINVSNVYSISYVYEGEFSLMNFLQDIKAFAGAGFNDFSRMLIALIVILAITVVSIKEGFRDPLVTGAIVFGLTLAFSYLGFFYINNTSIPSDWLRQYLISILVGLVVGAYFIKQET
jgi:hypothetical protein